MSRLRPFPAIAHKLLAATLMGALVASAEADDTVVEFAVVRADTLIGLSRSVLTSPTAWREVARINKLPDPNRIRPGQHLRIPARLLRSDAVSATLVSVSGDVRAGDAPATTGAVVAEGQSVQTGPNGSAVLALADGSRVRLPPSSLAEVATSRRYGNVPRTEAAIGPEQAVATATPNRWFAGTLRVLRGSVEVFASKVLRLRPLEVVTPTAVVGVRGTTYRVGFDEEANGRTRGEVLEGAVRVATTGGGSGADLSGGFGASADASGRPPRVVPLSPAPDLSALPERFERPIVRFALPGDARSLRVQIAADPAFDQIVSDQLIASSADVRIVGLADAAWYLRARRVDAQGIEGLDADRRFVLKARPEPPASSAPRAGAKQGVGAVDFAWAPNVEAPRVRLQIAEDAAFERLVSNREGLEASTLRLDIARPGLYFWRVGSVRADGDAGPFGDPQRFELRPMPEPPTGGRSADGNALMFTWSGRAEDRHRVELASDLDFTRIVAKEEVSGADWTLPTPSSGGRYYFRYRSVEPDGFVSPYSQTLRVDVPRDWSGLGLLLPLLLLLL